MTAFAIYDDRLEVSFAPLWAFLATVMGAITGFFMSSDDDSYLSDDERAALADGPGEEETGDGGNNDDNEGDDQGGDEEGQGDDDGNKADDEPETQEGDADSKDAVAQTDQAPGEDPKAGGSDPGDNADKKDEPQSQQADADTSGTDAGDIDFDTIRDERLAELEQKYEDGKLEYDDYEKGKAQIEREIRKLEREHIQAQVKATVRQEMLDAKLQEAWTNDQKAFFAANPSFSQENAHPIIYRAFSEEVALLGAMPEWKTKSGADLLAEAKKNIESAFGLQTPAKKERTEGQNAVDKAKQANAAQDAPKTLKNVPAGEENKDNSFDYLDHLSGADYQKAINKMSPAEKERYEKSLQ